MKRLFFSWSATILIVVLAACDKVDDPFPDNNTGGPIDSSIVWDDSVFAEPNNGVRFVLLEEITGHKCNNCPAGAEKITAMQGDFGRTMIPVGIHASFFADPDVGGSKYPSDHRTEDGNKYFESPDLYNRGSLPGGMVSRIPKGGDFRLGDDEWKTAVQNILNDPGTVYADIDMRNYYLDSSRLVLTEVDVRWLSDDPGDLKLQLFLVEDSIVDWQKDNRASPPDIPDYVHRHMFRGAINSTWGADLSEGQTSGDTTKFSYSFNLNPLFVKKHCQIIAFIYRAHPDYEVVQANEAHITSDH